MRCTRRKILRVHVGRAAQVYRRYKCSLRQQHLGKSSGTAASLQHVLAGQCLPQFLPDAAAGPLSAMVGVPIGVQLLLIGIVKKNGIMIVDFALEAEREQGKSSTDAIYEASLLRFRPIMMTTMAALLGGLPLALGRGLGSELRRPLGIAMV